MVSLKHGLEAIQRARQDHIAPHTHPIEWNLSLAIEAALTAIRAMQEFG